MEKQLSGKIKIVEQGDNAAIVYVQPTGATNNVSFDANGISINGTAAMPISYSSAFQTTALSNTFGLIGSMYFSNIASFSWSSSVSSNSTTMYLKTS
jgi:hypothetical protein